MNRRTKAVTGAYTENRNRRLNMKNFEHYKRGYYMPPEKSTKWVEKEYVDKAPIWCSVDLRDGNQALIVPMLSLIHISEPTRP